MWSNENTQPLRILGNMNNLTWQGDLALFWVTGVQFLLVYVNEIPWLNVGEWPLLQNRGWSVFHQFWFTERSVGQLRDNSGQAVTNFPLKITQSNMAASWVIYHGWERRKLFVTPVLGWLVVLGFNTTLTAKVISWRSVMHICFVAFSHQN